MGTLHNCSITADRWRRIEDLFDKVADLPPSEQEATLIRECGDDRDLFEQVSRLLLHDQSRGARVAEAISGIAQITPPEEASYS